MLKCTLELLSGSSEYVGIIIHSANKFKMEKVGSGDKN